MVMFFYFWTKNISYFTIFTICSATLVQCEIKTTIDSDTVDIWHGHPQSKPLWLCLYHALRYFRSHQDALCTNCNDFQRQIKSKNTSLIPEGEFRTVSQCHCPFTPPQRSSKVCGCIFKINTVMSSHISVSNQGRVPI